MSDDNLTTNDVVTPPVSHEAPTPESGGTPTVTEQVPETTAQEQTGESQVDEATVTRMQQQMAKNDRLLNSLGIDPNSDVADRLEAGLVTPDDLLTRYRPEPTALAPPPVRQPSVSEERNLIDKIQKDGADQDDLVKTLELIEKMAQKNQFHAEQAAVQSTIAQCKDSVNNVLERDSHHSQMPEDLKAVEQQMFLSSTDSVVLHEAEGAPNPASYMSPQVYSFYAKKNAENLNKLRNHWINVGKQQMTVGGNTSIQPVSSSDGGSPNTPPPIQPNKDNWRQLGKQYMSARGIV